MEVWVLFGIIDGEEEMVGVYDSEEAMRWSKECMGRSSYDGFRSYCVPVQDETAKN